jgi:hypothetical protein
MTTPQEVYESAYTNSTTNLSKINELTHGYFGQFMEFLNDPYCVERNRAIIACNQRQENKKVTVKTHYSYIEEETTANLSNSYSAHCSLYSMWYEEIPTAIIYFYHFADDEEVCNLLVTDKLVFDQLKNYVRSCFSEQPKTVFPDMEHEALKMFKTLTLNQGEKFCLVLNKDEYLKTK